MSEPTPKTPRQKAVLAGLLVGLGLATCLAVYNGESFRETVFDFTFNTACYGGATFLVALWWFSRKPKLSPPAE